MCLLYMHFITEWYIETYMPFNCLLKACHPLSQIVSHTFSYNFLQSLKQSESIPLLGNHWSLCHQFLLLSKEILLILTILILACFQLLGRSFFVMTSCIKLSLMIHVFNQYFSGQLTSEVPDIFGWFIGTNIGSVLQWSKLQMKVIMLANFLSTTYFPAPPTQQHTHTKNPL